MLREIIMRHPMVNGVGSVEIEVFDVRKGAIKPRSLLYDIAQSRIRRILSRDIPLTERAIMLLPFIRVIESDGKKFIAANITTRENAITFRLRERNEEFAKVLAEALKILGYNICSYEMVPECKKLGGENANVIGEIDGCTLKVYYCAH